MASRLAMAAFASLAAASFFVGITANAQVESEALDARLDRLEAEITSGEDLSALKRLQRVYGYYLDKGMWTDLAELFTEDAVANYPAGVYIGKTSITRHLYMNVGGGEMGEVGLGDNRLYNHMNLQPVVHLDPGGETARGRWRAFATFGGMGGAAIWAEGIYNFTYAKENGVWKIRTLDYHSGFAAPYETGWVAPEQPRQAGGRRNLPHPADRERNMPCDGFPQACIVPFHYENPGSGSGGSVWTVPDVAATQASSPEAASASSTMLRERVTDLAARAERLRDEQDIENLQKIYGYYVDRRMWDHVADLFAEDGTIEMALRGVYVGRERVREFLDLLGPQGLTDGVLNDHVQLQPVVTVAPDGLTAKARSRELGMTGVYESHGEWSEGIFENTFVKEDGVWKYKSLRFFPTFITDYDLGWAKDAKPAPAASTELPPDRPPTVMYEIYPKAHIPPFHYKNPVTGADPTYPTGAGRPTRQAIQAVLAPVEGPRGAPRRSDQIDDLSAAVAEAERDIGRVKDYHEIENLENAYGYYLDKNLWNDLADLFAEDGSMELAQRGVFEGRERVRGFLFDAFGSEGPVEGRLGNHVQMQHVIHVAPDGQSAKIRARMMQQLNFGGRPSMGASAYENEAVKEDGVWKFKAVHAYNTWTASYDGGWARSPGRRVPGPSETYPPDAPPSFVFDMFPNVYEIPFHYDNPVTGRPAVPAVPAVPAGSASSAGSTGSTSARQTDLSGAVRGFETAARSADSSAPVQRRSTAVTSSDSGPASTAPSGSGLKHPPGMSTEIAEALREIGPRIEAQATAALYAPLQPKEPYSDVAVSRDLKYGPDERNVLDVFTTPEVERKGVRALSDQAGSGKPVVVFVHGGGFTRGAKRTPGSPFYDNVMLWAVSQGFVGVNINYRLAPDHMWPSGIEDLKVLTDWLEDNIGVYGGDPAKIFLWGHSAGAAHVADYLADVALSSREEKIAGAILTSGFYDLGDEVSIWQAYYGDDVSTYDERSSLPGLLKTGVPLLVTDAELDPESFQVEAEKLERARAEAGKPVLRVHLPNHSHISETYAVNTDDRSLSGPVQYFIETALR